MISRPEGPAQARRGIHRHRAIGRDDGEPFPLSLSGGITGGGDPTRDLEFLRPGNMLVASEAPGDPFFAPPGQSAA